MAVIKPFKALRPVEKSADSVASVPYDVVNTKKQNYLPKEIRLVLSV